jgi:hypothetical protein
MNWGPVKALVALGVCLGVPAPGVAHPVLSFDEHTETRPLKNSTVKAGSEEFPLRVTLGKSFAVAEAKGARHILDFEKRRVYRVHLADKKYYESSMFAVLGFHAMELQNRVRLNAMLNAAKVETETNVPALAEHLFSLRAPGQSTVIDSAPSNGATEYRWNGKELLSISDKSQALPSGYQSQYWRWLRYTVGGHPSIYSALDARAGVPERLKVLRPDVGGTVVTLQLTGITNDADAPYSLVGLAPSAPEREPYITLRKVGGDAKASLTARNEAALRERDGATAQGRLLDAWLAHFAQSLSAGDASTAWLAQVRERSSSDQDARALVASLRAANAEQARQAVSTLSSLRGKTTSPYAYVLDVFAANHLVGLKQTAEAEKMFVSALSANPYLTGAWLDMGKLYYTTFRTEEAWACWDAGRAMKPDHQLARGIDEMERKMVAEHPEFF